MLSVPDNWLDLMARYRFFAALPRPLAVMIACDLASLLPQDAVGRQAIDASRQWLLGQRRDRELSDLTDRAFAGVGSGGRQVENISRFAAACTLGVAVAKHDSAVAAALAAAAIAHHADENGSFERQRRWVVELVRVAEDPTVRGLLRAAETDLSARAVFWDAMHDAGYAPIIAPPA